MDFESLRDFVAVVDGGGISAGARLRGQPKQNVSRRLALLERGLNIRLIDRSPKAQRVTPEGQLLYERARAILDDLEEARQVLVDQAATPTGLLRISAPQLMGEKLLGCVLARYHTMYPQVRIETVLSDRKVDLIEDGFDLAIRIGQVDDVVLISRTFAHAHSILVASPTFMTSHSIESLRDLETTPCILFGQDIEQAYWTCYNTNGKTKTDVAVRGLFIVNSLQLALDCAKHGAGIANVPSFLARPLLDEGALVRVLPQWETSRVDLNVVFTSRRQMSARLRTFIDVLVSCFPERRL